MSKVETDGFLKRRKKLTQHYSNDSKTGLLGSSISHIEEINEV